MVQIVWQVPYVWVISLHSSTLREHKNNNQISYSSAWGVRLHCGRKRSWLGWYCFCNLPKVNVPFSDGLKVIHQTLQENWTLLRFYCLYCCLNYAANWGLEAPLQAFVVANSACAKCINLYFHLQHCWFFSRKH